MTPEQYRQYLHCLSDQALFQESVARILDYRGLPKGSPARKEINDLAAMCWGECQDRDEPDLYLLALADARQKEADRRRVNNLPLTGGADS